MDSWQTKLNKGKYYLSRHKPCMALKSFYEALKECPVSNSKSLSRLLFYLGITLKRLGYPNPALKSWLASQKLKRCKYSLKMIKRFVNEYGMARQSSSEQDDWEAFYSIQMKKYLNGKKVHRFKTSAEKDMIRDLITDHFRVLKANKFLEQKTPAEKNSLFRKVKIVFPFLYMKENNKDPLIHIDFLHKKRINSADRCPCGSGLSYMVCCGRTPASIELLNGLF
jgi:hypothetical protein